LLSAEDEKSRGLFARTKAPQPFSATIQTAVPRLPVSDRNRVDPGPDFSGEGLKQAMRQACGVLVALERINVPRRLLTAASTLPKTTTA